MKQRQLCAGIIFFIMMSAPSVFAKTYREEGIRIGSGEFMDIPGISIGSTSLKAAVTTKAQYDSNVFLSADNEQGDWIGILGPKLLWDIPLGIDRRHLVQLMYSAEIATYADHDSQNYIDQHVAANANVKLPWGYFNVQDNFKDMVDRADTEFTAHAHRQENRAQTTLGVEINKLTYELSYGSFLTRYADSRYDVLEYGEDIISGTVFYQLFPKTKALLEYDHGIVTYVKDTGREGNYNDVMAGLKGILTGKTTGTVKAGYKNRNYKDSGQDGFAGFVAQAILQTRFSERREIAIKYVRDVFESITTNNHYYDSNAVTVSFIQKIWDHFSLLLNGGYRRNAYPNEETVIGKKRRDSVWSPGVALRYEIKDWANISLGYSYLERMSNVDTEEYQDNIVSLRFDFLF